MPQAPQTRPSPSGIQVPARPVSLLRCLLGIPRCPPRCQAKTCASPSLTLSSRRSPSPVGSTFKVLSFLGTPLSGTYQGTEVSHLSGWPRLCLWPSSEADHQQHWIRLVRIPGKKSSLLSSSLHAMPSTVLGSEQLLRKWLSNPGLEYQGCQFTSITQSFPNYSYLLAQTSNLIC